MQADANQPESGIRPSVAVVVVNYRTAELAAEAVRSVLPDPLVHEVVVVDNASGDGSVDTLRSAFPDLVVRIVASPTNLGFGRGANLGVSLSRAPFVFLLNSDAVVRPGALARLCRVLAEDAVVGVVAPAVYLADGRTLQADAYGSLPARNALLRMDVRKRGRRSGRADDAPGWVSGAAMMLRRDDFVALGGFDPAFTMYLEDVDLCRRLQTTGRRIVREPAAAVVHLGGRSSATRITRFDQFHRSKAVYLRKAGAGPFQLRCAAALRLARLGVEHLRARRRRPHG